MMETYLHVTIRLTVCAYLLYRTWNMLFHQKLFGLWDRVFVRPKEHNSQPALREATPEGSTDVVGKTTVVYLEDPELAAKVPAHSEKLESGGFIGEEPEISSDDVESDLSSNVVTPEELLEERERFEEQDDLAPGLDPDFSCGLTYEEMTNAVGVLTVPTTDEAQIMEAARTIHRIKNSDLFEFFTNQVSNLDNVEKLMNDCLADDGTPLSVRKSKKVPEEIHSFNMKKYV